MTVTIGSSAPTCLTRVHKRRLQLDTYQASLLVTISSALAAIAILVEVEGRLAPRSACMTGTLVLMLWCAHLFYQRQRRDDCVATSLGGLTLVMVSGIAAGAISQAGLALGWPVIDPLLARGDEAIGFSAQGVTGFLASNAIATGLLGLAYMSSFPLFLVSLLLLSFKRSTHRGWALCFMFAM